MKRDALTCTICRVVVIGDEHVGKSTLIATLSRLPLPEPIPDERGISATLLDLVGVEITYTSFTAHAHLFTSAHFGEHTSYVDEQALFL